MINVIYRKQPLYFNEALAFLIKIVNGLEWQRGRPNVVDLSRSETIQEGLQAISKQVVIRDRSLYRYFSNSQACLASCLVNSVTSLFEREEDDIVNVIVDRIETLKHRKIDEMSLSTQLDIRYGNEAYSFLSEMLKLPLSDHDLVMLIKAFDHPKLYLEKIMADILAIEEQLSSFVQSLTFADLESSLSTDGVKKILQTANLNYDEEIVLYPSIVEFNILTIHVEESPKKAPAYMRCGFALDFEKIQEINLWEKNLDIYLGHFLKVINDKSKLKILELLKTQEMYGAQLAEKLGLKTSTISYHIDALLNAGVIKARRYNNRVYYQYDKARTLAILDRLRKQFE